MGIFSILQDWLKKGENASKFKIKNIKETRRGTDVIKEAIEEPRYLIRLLEIKDGRYKLVGKNKGLHQYHLLLLRILDEAILNNNINTYHLALLRQVLESIASFLGEGRFGYVLEELDFEDANTRTDIINALSHEKIYTNKLEILNPDDKRLLIETLNKLTTKFPFSI